MANQLKNILKSYSLRATEGRIELLNLFFVAEHALSHQEIESKLKGSQDRVTIYRNLKSFTEKGIIHQVFDSSQAVKYALCQDCSKDHHHDTHIHFECNTCKKTYCLDKENPIIRLPKNYSISDVQVLIQGTCPNCS